VWFEAVSGLRVNLNNSSILLVGKWITPMYSQVFWVVVWTLTSSYIGLPLRAKFKEKFIPEPVIERFHKKYLAGKHLTKKYLLVFSFSIPCSVANKLEGIQRSF